jgi:uncharacterized protein DUF6941
MAIIHKYTLVCDDVRQENNGKLIILGLYTPHIVAFGIPMALPSLSFFQTLESDRPGQYTFRLQLQHLETGHQVAEARGVLNFLQPGQSINVVRFTNVLIDRLGTYNVILTLEDHREPITTSFDIILGTQQPQPGMPPRR